MNEPEMIHVHVSIQTDPEILHDLRQLCTESEALGEQPHVHVQTDPET